MARAVIRPDGVDHPPGREIARGGPAGIAGPQAVREALDAVLENRGPAGPVNGAVDAAATTSAEAAQIIQTVRGEGYVLAADVKWFGHAES